MWCQLWRQSDKRGWLQISALGSLRRNVFFFKNRNTQNSTTLVFLYLSAFRVHYTCIQGDISEVVKSFDVFMGPGKGKKFLCLFFHFAQVVWRKIFLINLETLFHCFGVTTYPAYSLILDFIFSQFPKKGRLYQGLSIPIAN